MIYTDMTIKLPCVLRFRLSSLPVFDFHATTTVCTEVKRMWLRTLLKLYEIFAFEIYSDEERLILKIRRCMQQWNPSSGVLFPSTGWLDSTPVCIPEWSF